MSPDSIEAARAILDERFSAREIAITESRKVIRACANAIRALHRGEVDRADELISEAGDRLVAMQQALAGHPDIANAGYSHDAAKEYSEARLTAALFRGHDLPGFGELGVDPVPYLHGLGESVGEMRRRLLDLLRSDRVTEAARILEVMDEIVDRLAEVDYPDGMTHGLRRTTDVSRSLVERSRADLTATVVQERLRRDLSGS